ncbi:MAG: hypothetical protein WCQ82_03805 [Bacteroidaceae bacterium]
MKLYPTIRNILVACFVLLTTQTIVAQERESALKHVLQQWPKSETFPISEEEGLKSHSFFTLSLEPLLTDDVAGDNSFLHLRKKGVKVNSYIGKWLTPVHGVRAGIAIGLLENDNVESNKLKMIGLSVDYLMNISALGWGYNKDRKWELLGTVGLGYDYTKVNGVGAHVGNMHFGLQSKWYLTPCSDFFLEPRLYLYTDNLDRQSSNARGYNLGTGLQVGITHHFVPTIARKAKSPFQNSSLKDNVFLSISMGVNTLLNKNLNDLSGTVKRMGPIGKVAIGKWFSPLFGARFSLGAALSQTDKATAQKTRYGIIQGGLDYLINLNNFFNYYHNDEKASFWLTPGVTYAYQHHQGDEKGTWGAGIGFQGNFRMNSTTNFFVEPRINVYHNNVEVNTFSPHSNVLAELNIGLLYHAANYRAANKKEPAFTKKSLLNNLFFSIYGGLQAPIITSSTDELQCIGPKTGISVGKWINPTSGIRLSAEAGFFRLKGLEEGHRKNASLSIDYLLNLNSMLYGYNPTRKFDLIASAGLNMSYVSRKDNPYTTGFNLGLQGLWSISNRIGLFIEPQMKFYNNDFLPGSIGIAKSDVIGSIIGGVQFTMNGYESAPAYKAFKKNDKRTFVSIGAGIEGLVSRDYFERLGPSASVSIGKWMSPVAGWRIGADLSRLRIKKSTYLEYGGAHMDYLVNLSTIFAGYDANRAFNVTGFAGVNLGVTYTQGDTRIIPGLNAGFQFRKDITPSVGLFIEPKMTLYNDRYDHSTSPKDVDPTLSVQAGVQFFLNNSNKSYRRKENTDFEKSIFVSAGLGTGLYNQKIHGALLDNATFNSRFSIGKKLTPLSSVRANLENINFVSKSHFSVLSIGVDYMFNVTNFLAGYSADRILDIVAIGGLKYTIPSGRSVGKNGWGASFGTQAKINLNLPFSFFIEPQLSIFDGKITNKNSKLNYFYGASIMGGIIFNL